jgi:hypothetical protein
MRKRRDDAYVSRPQGGKAACSEGHESFHSRVVRIR